LPVDNADLTGAVPQPISPLFAGIAEDMLARLLADARTVRVDAQDWLFRQGEPPGSLYVVRSGRLSVSVENGGRQTAVRTVGPGSALGELALLTRSPRSASVQAVRDSELVEVDAERFEELVRTNSTFAVSLLRELARQLQASGGLELPSTRPVVLSVVGRGDASDRFSDELERSLEALGSVVAITEPDLDAAADFGRLVDGLEERFDRVILIARGPGAWQDFCARQADRVVQVVDEGVVELPTQLDRGRLELVFPAASPRIAQWLAELKPRTYHVLEAGDRYVRSVGRVARRLSGRALGLVLSGGGARGYAHVGAVDVLLRKGFEVDRVGGCSIGSFVGAMVALGWETEEMRETCEQDLARHKPFNDYTFPRVSLIRARKAARMLERLFGETQMEELPRPLFAVSANLLSGLPVVHREGPLVRAVGASMSIPGIAPPLPFGTALLVDGGILNNLPVDVMAEADEGPIVAIDVVRRMSTESETPPVPTIGETLARATVLGGTERAEANRRLADLLVIPDVQQVPLRGWNRVDEAIEAGKRAMEAALESGGGEALEAAKPR
jgi:NTE family protein